jgi:hypothetical protein
MTVVRIKHPSRPSPVARKVTKDLLWYDVEKKKMCHFKGGQLKYEHRLDSSINPPKYRLLPKVSELEETVILQKIDKVAIDQWLVKYQSENTIIIDLASEYSDAQHVAIDIPDELVEDVLDDLEDSFLQGEAV